MQTFVATSMTCCTVIISQQNTFGNDAQDCHISFTIKHRYHVWYVKLAPGFKNANELRCISSG